MNFLNRHRNWFFLLIVVAGVALYVWQAGGGFPLDDSWIHQSYGRNLGERGEWALIPGQPSAASTAPFYTVLLATGYALGVPHVPWAHLLGILALWVTAVLGANLAQRSAPSIPWAGLWAGSLVAMTWQLMWAAASGMETALAAMWTVVLPLLALRESDPERAERGRHLVLRGALFGGMSALAVLTRPELVLMVCLAGLLVLFWRPAGWGGLVWWLLGAALTFALLMTPYLWLNLSLAGGVLPNTSAAKQVQHTPLLATPYLTRVWWMLQPLGVGGQLLLLPAVALFVYRAGARFWVLPVWVLGLVAVYAARLPAAYQHGRYVMPALPLLVIMGAVGMAWFWRWGRRRMLWRVLVQTMVLAALAVFVVMLFVVSPQIYARDVAVINEEMVASARWLDANIPPEALLAVHDIGAVAYITPRPLVDIAGLVSPQVIPYINRPTQMWQYLEQQGVVYLMAFPNQIPATTSPAAPSLCPVFTTEGRTAPTLGASNMGVYSLSWDAACDA